MKVSFTNHYKIVFQIFMMNMPEKILEEYKTLLTRIYYIKNNGIHSKTLSDLCSYFWVEIFNQQYNFDRTNVKVDYVNKITMHNFSTFLEVTIFYIFSLYNSYIKYI